MRWILIALMLTMCCAPRVDISRIGVVNNQSSCDMLREETCVRLMWNDDVLGLRDTVLIAVVIRQTAQGFMVLPKTGGWVHCREWRPEKYADGCKK